MRRAYGPEHPDVVYATGLLGRNQYYLGRGPRRSGNAVGADGEDPDGAPSPMDTVRFGRFLVTMLVDQRRWKEAEPLALRVFAIQDSLQDTLARLTAGQLAAIYDATGGRSGRSSIGRGWRRMGRRRPKVLLEALAPLAAGPHNERIPRLLAAE